MAPILIILGIFLLYKLVVDFIIPIYKASKRMQAQFRNMQQGNETVQDPLQTNRSKTGKPTRNSSDYIDFEEIRD